MSSESPTDIHVHTHTLTHTHTYKHTTQSHDTHTHTHTHDTNKRTHTHTHARALLTTLASLEACDIDRSTISHIVTVARKCTAITGLNLSDNSLGPSGAESLISQLKSLHNITFLE